MLRLLHLEKERYSSESLKELENEFNVTYFNPNLQSELNDHLVENKYEIIFTKLGLAINRKVINLLPNLKSIVTPTTGLNHIDMEYAKLKAVKVLSLKGEVELLKEVRSTAEHTWMLLLSLIRNLPQAFVDVKYGSWRRKPFLADELDGKTLGIIGYGRLGKIIANYAVAFNMNVIINDIDSNAFKDANKNIKSVSLDYLLSESDVVSIHIPSNTNNFQFMNSEKFSQMKDGAVLINTARGEVIDEKDLLNALKSKKIGAAALDVLNGDSVWEEKSPINHNLIEYAQHNTNLIITPHMGGYGKVSIAKTRDFITDKFLKSYEKY